MRGSLWIKALEVGSRMMHRNLGSTSVPNSVILAPPPRALILEDTRIWHLTYNIHMYMYIQCHSLYSLFPLVGMISSNTGLFLELPHFFWHMPQNTVNESDSLHIFVTSVNFRHVLFLLVCSSGENKTRRNFDRQK